MPSRCRLWFRRLNATWLFGAVVVADHAPVGIVIADSFRQFDFEGLVLRPVLLRLDMLPACD
jgi:hypothetical protein